MRFKTRFPILTSVLVIGVTLCFTEIRNRSLGNPGFFSTIRHQQLPDGCTEVRHLLLGGISHGTCTTYLSDGTKLHEAEFRWGQYIEATLFRPNGTRTLRIHQEETGITRYDFFDEQDLFVRRE